MYVVPNIQNHLDSSHSGDSLDDTLETQVHITVNICYFCCSKSSWFHSSIKNGLQDFLKDGFETIRRLPSSSPSKDLKIMIQEYPPTLLRMLMRNNVFCPLSLQLEPEVFFDVYQCRSCFQNHLLKDYLWELRTSYNWFCLLLTSSECMTEWMFSLYEIKRALRLENQDRN